MEFEELKRIQTLYNNVILFRRQCFCYYDQAMEVLMLDSLRCVTWET